MIVSRETEQLDEGKLRRSLTARGPGHTCATLAISAVENQIVPGREAEI